MHAVPRPLRLASPADAPALLDIYAPLVRETAISFETEPPSAAAFAERIAGTLERWPWLVCEDEHGPLGYAYAGPHRSRAAYQWSTEVSVYVAERARRRGVGRRLYRATLGVLRAQGFCNAYAGIALPNAASVALHEALGFAPVGVYRRVGYKRGAWRDVGWWALDLRPARAAPPEPPRPLPALLESGELEALLAGA